MSARPRSVVARSMSEEEWQAIVIDLARLLKFRVAHFRPARTERGWRTPVAADGAGFPDLLLCRGQRILALELKAERGRLSAAQEDWLAALRAAGVEAHVLRPSQWDAAVEILQRVPA